VRRNARQARQSQTRSREEIIMMEGTLMTESLRVGTSLEDVKMTTPR
jgi:hypothetical protein